MEVKKPIFSEYLFDLLGNITVEQAQNGEGYEIARNVYKKAVKIGDDTTANEANTYVGMLEHTEKLGSKILRHFNEGGE